MSAKEVAGQLKCSLAHVYAIIDAGELSCYKIGMGAQGGIRVSEDQLLAYLKRKEQTGQAQGEFKHLKIK